MLLLQVNIVNYFIFLRVVRTLRHGQLHKTGNLKVNKIVVLKSTQKGLPAPDSDASYNCGFSKGKWPGASRHDGAAFTLPSMALIG